MIKSRRTPAIPMAEYLNLPIPSFAQDVPAAEPDASACASVPDDLVAEQVEVSPESRLVFHTEPHTPAADRIRHLRMHLRTLCAARNLKTLLITSPIARDGKSTLAMNLATALAHEGNRVLLVDADLHRSPLASILGLAPRPGGLADCLERGIDPFSVMRRLDPLGWYLLPAGQASGNATDLLQTSGYGSVVKSLSEHFDWILVDSPPVVALTDAVFLRQHSDGTLLVIRAGHTPQQDVDEAVRHLGQQNIVAIVLNAVEGLDQMYYKYGGGYYGKPNHPNAGPDNRPKSSAQ